MVDLSLIIATTDARACRPFRASVGAPALVRSLRHRDDRAVRRRQCRNVRDHSLGVARTAAVSFGVGAVRRGSARIVGNRRDIAGVFLFKRSNRSESTSEAQDLLEN